MKTDGRQYQAGEDMDARVKRLEAECERLRALLEEMYRWANNVEIRGEGMHKGPIWFAQVAGVPDEYIEDNDCRDELMERIEAALEGKRNG